MKKNNYISRMFAILSVLLAAVATIMSISIYKYSQKAVSNEIANLNDAVLGQVSDNTSRGINDAVSLCNKIAYDSKLIEFLETPSVTDKKYLQTKEMMSIYVENMVNNYTWSQSNHKNLFEAYVIGYNGIDYSTYTNKFNLNDIKSDPKYREAFMSNEDAVLINTFQDPQEKGIYRYAFQVAREIRDHITQEPCGFVILNISEKVLYDTFDKLVSDNKKVMIVDEKGIILSSKDKRLVGERYLDSTKITSLLTKENGHNVIKNDKGASMLFFNRIQGTHWYFIEEMELSKVLSPLQNIKTFVFFITAVCIGIFLILSRCFANKTSEPIINIRNKMEQVTEGNLSVRADIKNNDEFGRIAKSFNEMVQQIEYLLMTVKQEEHKKRLAELDFLRAQINPHFIYNTLSSIRFYVEMNKNVQAEEMLFHFSKILRKTLSRSDEFITIREELETIEEYIKLQKLRYVDSFEVVYDISEDILDYMIPTFILQPIVENSIFYSVGQERTGLITITGKSKYSKIKITIADNGIGMSEQQIDKALSKEMNINKVGLINVHERIQLNYGMDYGLNIVSQEGKGTQVTLTLPE